MKNLFFTLASIASFILAGIAFAQDTKIDYDHNFDFKTLKTFAVKLGTSWGNPLSEKRVMDEVSNGIMKKGWIKAGEDSANALVMIHGATEDKKELSTFYSGYSGWGYGGWGGMSTAHTRTYEYTVGTLVVDIFDVKSKQLVFRGTAADELSGKPEKNQKKIKKAVEKMFKEFPPGSSDKKK
jgi:Domain of unknown function (DUF4136)